MTELALTVVMSREVAAALRTPFEDDKIGLKPTIWCKTCRDNNKYGKTCDNHKKAWCEKAPDGCGQNITEAHSHIRFVGHADVTSRLLEIDPLWDWEPLAWEGDLPKFDANGGLWIRLTVAGVTRIGYGGADGDHGEDGIKEAISDAIKTTAMRFGVALDLWRTGAAKAKAPAKTSSGARPAQNSNSARPARPAMPERPKAPPRTAAAQPAQAAAAPAAEKAAAPADKEAAALAADAQLAKDELRAHVARMKYDPDKVLVAFEQKYGQTLRAATDPIRIRAFTKLLDGMPAHELGAAPEPAGAQA